MAHPKPVFTSCQKTCSASRLSPEHCATVQPDYIAVFNDRRKFVEVSPSFCKLLGYAENEIIGRPFEDFTVPRTNNIPFLVQMLIKNGYLQGIWVFGPQERDEIVCPLRDCVSGRTDFTKRR